MLGRATRDRRPPIKHTPRRVASPNHRCSPAPPAASLHPNKFRRSGAPRVSLAPDFFLQPLRLEPHFSARPWGGDALARVLAKPVPADRGPVGESWELSDHPDGRSRVAGTTMTFGDVLRAHPRPMIGRDAAPEKYPLLVKYIDAGGDLSVQVHPDDAWCRRTGHPDRGKSECWYVMDCAPGTEVIYGFLAGVGEAEARAALAAGHLGELLVRRPIRPGQFLTIPPGCVHAMLSGTLVCEIQQSSNTTFRLYDWDRQPPRELHIDQSLAVSIFDSRRLPNVQQTSAQPARFATAAGTRTELLANEFFRVVMADVAAGARQPAADLAHETGAILNVVMGDGALHAAGQRHPLRRGETLYLPAAATRDLTLEAGPNGLRVLRTTSLEL